jgi:hypothetical protein
MKIKYFKTYQEAQNAQAKYAGQTFPNPYQFENENKNAKIVEFVKGFAIQFGDCGPYLEAQS